MDKIAFAKDKGLLYKIVDVWQKFNKFIFSKFFLSVELISHSSAS